jgi:dsDNA-specific endonuclease/ATPase MutS2
VYESLNNQFRGLHVEGEEECGKSLFKYTARTAKYSQFYFVYLPVVSIVNFYLTYLP